MKDLSPRDRISALVPTAQEAGNMLSSRERALSAPGSDPVTKLPGVHDQADPNIDDTAYDPKGRVHVVNDAGGRQIPDSNTARPTPFTADDGHGWRTTKPSTA